MKKFIELIELNVNLMLSEFNYFNKGTCNSYGPSKNCPKNEIL